MSYIETWNREAEIAIIDKLVEHRIKLAKGRRALAVCRQTMAKLNAQDKALKLELFVCRHGEDGLARRREGVAKNRNTLAQMKAVQRGEDIDSTVPTIIGGFCPVPDSVTEQQRGLLPPSGVNPDRIIAFEPRCDYCGAVITPRGMCKCPGKKHRKVRTLTLGPKIEIKHPPVPAFQMAAKEGGGE